MTDRQIDMESHPEPSALTVALSALTAFQGYVQQADSKVNTLLVVHTGGVVAVVSALAGRDAPVRFPLPTLLVMAGFAIAFLLSGFHVLQALRPRLDPPVPPSRFAITGINHLGLGHATGVDPAAQRIEAWAMAQLLAQIALVKNQHLARATPWTAAMLVLGVGAALLRSW
ncbi:hypothetical protein F4556_003680 [Kitasatospora gansuensis]|uniref:Pycsar effector protein domain-containing protein n=2 Tax=Kitasatospora TaxID=2063 RepID=A0A7W7SCV6_9ACTN|nr:hypothetical protein [Kitasatospora gansuensis]MBB4948145.1 hypothetical protein [Kitasatospora gansuensis]